MVCLACAVCVVLRRSSCDELWRLPTLNSQLQGERCVLALWFTTLQDSDEIETMQPELALEHRFAGPGRLDRRPERLAWSRSTEL
eukprot:m.51453 g.51453  ORF g.51453 m.51453 type:complete len:85 (-) comp6613_c0_seq2:7-261(-)